MAATGKRLEFWYDFASTYSYLSAMRIEEIAARTGVEVVWRPFLLGPIFKAQGWDGSPFNVYPAKGRYMIRDMQRICHDRGLKFSMPDPFPQPSLKAARVAMALEPASLASFSRQVFVAEFTEGRAIDDDHTLALILSRCGLDYARVFADGTSPKLKADLRARVADAQRLGVFGAPSFTTQDGELFWGDDRLEMALAAACRL